jgi:hypothetical protein
MVHATCVNEADLAQYQTDPLLAGLDVGEGSYARALGNKITLCAAFSRAVPFELTVSSERLSFDPSLRTGARFV